MMNDLNIKSQFTLNDGNPMPRFGLGVYMSEEGITCYKAVRHALELGYRLIDTASFYKNEHSVGKAIRDSGIPREEIYVTTKLWNADHGTTKARTAFEKSLKLLDIGYIDHYLIHYPVPGNRIQTWNTLVSLSNTDLLRSIGVSNYMPWHLEEIVQNSDVIPAINQFELSPFCYQSRMDMIKACQARNIQVENYSPLVRGKVFENETLVQIAKELNKTPAQILIRWALEKDFAVIPKSSNPVRIAENAAVFDFRLGPELLEKLDDLDQNLILCWDPSTEK